MSTLLVVESGIVSRGVWQKCLDAFVLPTVLQVFDVVHRSHGCAKDTCILTMRSCLHACVRV